MGLFAKPSLLCLIDGLRQNGLRAGPHFATSRKMRIPQSAQPQILEQLPYVIRQRNMKNFIFLWDRPIKTQLTTQTRGISAELAVTKRHKKQRRTHILAIETSLITSIARAKSLFSFNDSIFQLGTVGQTGILCRDVDKRIVLSQVNLRIVIPAEAGIQN